MIPFPTDVRDRQFVLKANWFGYQQHQAAGNLKAHDEYVSYAQGWLAANTKQLQQGLPLLSQPTPPPPQVIYNDDFTISNPPFPDLSTPVIDPKTVIPTVGPGFVGVNPTGATSDLQSIMAALSKLLSDVAAIKGKVGA